jgi:hypothetical protein
MSQLPPPPFTGSSLTVRLWGRNRHVSDIAVSKSIKGYDLWHSDNNRELEEDDQIHYQLRTPTGFEVTIKKQSKSQLINLNKINNNEEKS